MTMIASLVALAMLAPVQAAVQPGHDEHHPSASLAATPESIHHEHAEIHAALERATHEPGELGAAAKALAQVLDPHFKREEEIATPPLGLLAALSKGPVTPEMRRVLPMTNALEKELPQMLAEHRRIMAARERFEAAARSAGQDDCIGPGRALA